MSPQPIPVTVTVFFLDDSHATGHLLGTGGAMTRVGDVASACDASPVVQLVDGVTVVAGTLDVRMADVARVVANGRIVWRRDAACLVQPPNRCEPVRGAR